MKFRKKPVVIEARQLTIEKAEEIGEWCGALKCIHDSYESYLWGWGLPVNERSLTIQTLEGEMTAALGDWIIKGVKGEFYPCKPDIFEATYEPVEENEMMDFGDALAALKAGSKVARNGWNGKGMWLELQVPDEYSHMTLPYVYLNYPEDAQNTPGARVPWLASQTDMLAEDWRLFD